MVGGLIELPSVLEDDGCLTYFESCKEISFEIKRCFYIFDVPEGRQRADHASMTTDFLIIAINGSIEVELDDGIIKSVYKMNNRLQGLIVPKFTWMKTSKFSANAVLLVLASTRYKDEKYISDYEEFVKYHGRK